VSSREPDEKMLSETERQASNVAVRVLEAVIERDLIALIVRNSRGEVQVVSRPGFERATARILEAGDWTSFRRVVDEHIP